MENTARVKSEEMVGRIDGRLMKNKVIKGIFLAATAFTTIILMVLLYRIISQGAPYLSWDFFQNFASRRPEQAGIKAAVIGTIWMMSVVIPTAAILGVGTAIYLEEYAKKSALTRWIQMNISNLAGVPSVVFGLLGLTIFVRVFGFGNTIIAAGFTMALLVLPVVIVASQEAIRAVPNELKEASFGLGATKWQTIYRVVLPYAIPGIATGSILAFSRAIGETAPLIVVGIPTFVAFLPSGYLDQFTALPMQIYNWTSRPQVEFHNLAAAGIIILLAVLILMNSVAVWIRNRFQAR
ncbi:phosphate ABC transporter permease PstA [Domibacillus enclensis]|uniref:Phosphate transport system permease protein PstA n=1 Tax=Domibacillus enclensis TaxID=1017273 RepID=A0A1N6PLI2_9BACI|nr:phosphate ABC transporter permease PstA [Domibacillus enclensis]OXS80410.1 phosphate ABC transporter, permease protein PstA [Domibacillus enclensis]SIQ05210.1 phosphate ABC transporter membrane protein 2, PhoT family [Domibacillus enclensis]